MLFRNFHCPYCGSKKYKETLLKEECKDCGLLCDYENGIYNQVYEDYMDEKQSEYSFEVWWTEYNVLY